MKPIKSLSRAIAGALIMAVLIIGLVAFSPIWIPWLAVKGLRERLSARRFLKTHAGQSFFIWRSRHAWHDFIRNNVLPVLPEGVTALRDRAPRPTAVRVILRAKLEWRSEHRGNPLLAFVGRRTVRIASLNDDLQGLKQQARRTPEARDAVARIVQDAIWTVKPQA